MTVVAAPSEEYHSRFDEEHYRNCPLCYDDYFDFMYDCEMDARMDADAEQERYNNEGDEDE